VHWCVPTCPVAARRAVSGALSTGLSHPRLRRRGAARQGQRVRRETPLRTVVPNRRQSDQSAQTTRVTDIKAPMGALPHSRARSTDGFHSAQCVDLEAASSLATSALRFSATGPPSGVARRASPRARADFAMHRYRDDDIDCDHSVESARMPHKTTGQRPIFPPHETLSK
jgi:hypothetical protein